MVQAAVASTAGNHYSLHQGTPRVAAGTRKGRTVPEKDDYAIVARKGRRVRAPRLAYKPLRPKKWRPRIGVIGCGGIIESHLEAYRRARYRVVALADLDRSRAEAARDRFFPRAAVERSSETLLARNDIDIVDIATHPKPRLALVEQAVRCGKHVLSQKPFVEDLEAGKRLVRLARRRNVALAVNQNGRWAPHVAYARKAIEAGLLGDVTSVDLAVHWDHNWCAGTPFDRIRHLVLYDFGIHWFDMVHCYFKSRKPKRVYATVARTPSQRTRPPLMAQALIELARGQASIVLRADTRYGMQDRTVIVGTKGTLVAEGPDLNHQSVTLYTEAGYAVPKLTTRWFDDGFDGSMSELIGAIEDRRRPEHDAGDNLQSLALCFSALASAETGVPVKVGSVTRLPS